MMNRSQRAMVAMTVLVTALCADQLLAVDGMIRPQVVAEVADRVAGRLMTAFRKQEPSLAIRQEPRMRLVLAVATPQRPDDLTCLHPAKLPVHTLRLPPPVLL
jgi:hypothetical protein